MKETLIVAVPMSIDRHEFESEWYGNEFANERKFQETWDAYVDKHIKQAIDDGYDEYDFEVYTPDDICITLNNGYTIGTVQYFAPVYIG